MIINNKITIYSDINTSGVDFFSNEKWNFNEISIPLSTQNFNNIVKDWSFNSTLIDLNIKNFSTYSLSGTVSLQNDNLFCHKNEEYVQFNQIPLTAKESLEITDKSNNWVYFKDKNNNLISNFNKLNCCSITINPTVSYSSTCVPVDLLKLAYYSAAYSPLYSCTFNSFVLAKRVNSFPSYQEEDISLNTTSSIATIVCWLQNQETNSANIVSTLILPTINANNNKIHNNIYPAVLVEYEWGVYVK